jgi:hypothetical protein
MPTIKYKNWSLDNFDEGFIKNRIGRFFVKVPGHHRANKTGYVLRSVVAFEEYWKPLKVMPGMVIHHVDGNILNDDKLNLQLMEHGHHSRFHKLGKKRPEVGKKLKRGKYLICRVCGEEFYRKRAELTKEHFCSRKCLGISQRVDKTKKCPYCGKIFNREGHAEQVCCSNSCAQLLRRRGINV